MENPPVVISKLHFSDSQPPDGVESPKWRSA